MPRRSAALVILVCVAGCARVRVDTNAYLGDLPFPEASSEVKIYVESNAQDEPALLAREVTRAVSRELESRGYICVTDPKAADYVLACVFGIDQGHTVTRAVPWSSGYCASSHVYGVGGYIGTAHTYGSQTTYAEESYREFDRQLLVTLIDRAKFDEAREEDRQTAIVWQASAISTGASRDLRSIVRCMLAAVFEHFGEDTSKQRSHTFSKGSDRAKRFELHTD